jgi:hypothetical protein
MGRTSPVKAHFLEQSNGKKRPLQELLNRDKIKRAPEPLDRDVVSTVSELVERVGEEIDMELFAAKLEQGIVDEACTDKIV